MVQMEESWNKNMTDEFNPSWINIMDNITMQWYNKFSPRITCFGRNPHTFGNDHHTICCGRTSILWRGNIFKGKDRPAQLVPKLHSELGGTVLLMIWMCQPLFHMLKLLVWKFFCVANSIDSLATKGVYAGSLIKQCLYWPKSVPGDLLDRKFSDMKVGYVDMLGSATEYGNPLRILCFKYHDYAMNIMEF